VFFHCVYKKRQILLCFSFKDKITDIIDCMGGKKVKDSCLYELFTDNLVRLHIVVSFNYFYNEAYNDNNFFNHMQTKQGRLLREYFVKEWSDKR